MSVLCRFKFVLAKALDANTSFYFKKGCMTPSCSLQPYKDALDSGYGRMGNWQKKNLALAMWYRNEAIMVNNHRFVVNIHGPDGSGRSHMKNLLLNYLCIKRHIDYNKVKVQDIKLRSNVDSRCKSQVIVIQDANSADPYLKIRLQSLTNKIIILISNTKLQIQGIEMRHLVLRPYSAEESYDLIVRRLQKRKLDRNEKEKLKLRLRSIPYQYASFIVREVPKIQDTHIDKYLQKNLKFQRTASQLEDQNIKQFQALIVISQFQRLSERSCKSLLNTLKICDPDSFQQFMFPKVGKRSEDRRYISAACDKPKFNDLSQTHIQKVYKPLVELLLSQTIQLISQSFRLNKHSRHQRLFDSTTRNEHSLLSIYITSNLCRFRSGERSMVQLDIEQLYQFIKENFGSEMYTKLIYPQMVYLCILIINLKLLAGPYDKYMNTILQNISKLRDDKNDKEFEKIEKNILRIIVSQTSIQIYFARRLEEQQGKEAVERATVYHIENCMRDIIKWKENLTTLLQKQWQQWKYLLAIIQFDLLLITVICETNNQPPKEINETEISRIQNLLVSYDRAQSYIDINHKNLQKDHAIRKEFVRLLLTGNPRLRLYSNINIKDPDNLDKESDLMCYYEFLQNRLRCVSLDVKTCDSAKLQMLNLYVKTYEMYESLLLQQAPQNFSSSRISTKSLSSFQDINIRPNIDLLVQPPLKNKGFSLNPNLSANKSFPRYLIRLLERFRDHLKRQIQNFLENTPIFTLLTSYPMMVQNECPQRKLWVSVQFNLKKKLQTLRWNTKNVILEHKLLNQENLKDTLARGSKYLCLWFEYKSSKGDDEIVFEKLDSKCDYEIKKCSSLTPPSNQFNYKIDTIFVCGNSKIGEILYQKQLCNSAVYFQIDKAPDQYNFYLKNIFQATVVEYFMSYLQQDEPIQNIYDMLMKEKFPIQFERLCKKVELKHAPKMLKKQENINQQKQLSLQRRQINYLSPKVYIMKMRAQLFDLSSWTDQTTQKNLNKKKTVAFIWKDKNTLDDFVDFYKDFCENKHTFPDGVQIVDWEQWNSSPINQEPVRFVDSAIRCKLSVMATRKSLLIMKNYSTLIARWEDKRNPPPKMNTFPRLIQILESEQNKMVTILFKSNEKDGYANKWHLIDFNNYSFKKLEAENGLLIPQNKFVGMKL